MPTIPSYLTAQDLVDAMGEPTYMAIFDDTNSGSRATVDASTGVTTVLRRTLAFISSWLPDIYAKLPGETPDGMSSTTDTIPALFKDACLQYGVVLSYRRHPEYVKTYGAQPDGPLMKELVEFMQRIQAGAQRVTPNDQPPEPTPENVGGSSQSDGSRIALTATDGVTRNSGDW